MPKISGADPRQSRTLQSLDRFTPEEIQAWAIAGLVLCDAITYGDIELQFPREESTWRMLNALADLQDCLRGDSNELPAALAGFLSTVEGANHG